MTNPLSLCRFSRFIGIPFQKSHQILNVSEVIWIYGEHIEGTTILSSGLLLDGLKHLNEPTNQIRAV